MDKYISFEMVKLQSFSGSEYNAWRPKTQFGLKSLQIFYTVSSNFSDTTKDVSESRWLSDEDYCRDYLLNCLSDRLARTYSKFKTAKEIWDNLDTQFRKEEELSKSHMVDKFLDFKFHKDMEITPQVIDLENLRSKMNNENIGVTDIFLVCAIIYKLPSI
ncbi:UBN2_2 domain-containing protein [Cephalotus follicularis]|uniref:UBN2_2 domain-containing protein n=1 Tax=Cephalotus follicularis TaxID=3775 RepID=A0A1Q3CAZ3_CEPFO|nr:UBN2_2 domain-containing protein [Cephalotus follicularis]